MATEMIHAGVPIPIVAARLAHARVATLSGGNPFRIARDALTNRAYITINNGSAVDVFNTTTNTFIATIPVGTNPRGVAVNAAASRAYVANQNSNTVSVIDTTTNTVIATIPVGNNPFGVDVA